MAPADDQHPSLSNGHWPSRRGVTHYGDNVNVGINLPTNWKQIAPNIPYFPWTKKLIDRWNKIEKLEQIRCSSPIMLYVETLVPAAITLYIGLKPPGAIDIIKARLNHSYNCGFKKLFADLEKYLPDPNPAGTKFLFRLTGLAFRIDWYFFVAEEVTEFVYNWESEINQLQQCDVQPFGGPCQLADAFNDISISGAFFPMNWHTKDQDPSNWAPGGSPWNQVAPGHIAAYKLWASAKFVNLTPFTQTVNMRIRDGIGGIAAGPVSVTLQTGQVASNVIAANVIATSPGQAAYIVEYSCSQSHFSGVQATAGSFTVASQ